MRALLCKVATEPVAIALLVVYITTDFLFAADAVDPYCNDFSTDGHCGVTSGGSQQADVTSMIQGRILVDRLGTQDAQTGDVNGPPAQDATPDRAHRDAAMVSMTAGQTITQLLLSASSESANISNEINASVTYAQDKQWNLHLLEGAVTAHFSGVTILMLLAVIGLTCITAWTVMFFGGASSDYRGLGTRQMSDGMRKDSQFRFHSNDHLLAPSQFPKLEQPAPVRLSARHVPDVSPERQVPEVTPPETSQLPPLCPTLLMPNNEARFGVPMYQIANLTKNGYGELDIVGIGTTPLLRAAVKKVGNWSTLEICMTGHNSVPRASLTTSTNPGTKTPQTLEIHGMQGFYGVLEMASHGACSVIKDGQTVLRIDGQADDLHLLLKSGIGATLADVRCAAEPFGGVDHIEIRVEAGIDTVLILAVVLAVLVLSPYTS